MNEKYAYEYENKYMDSLEKLIIDYNIQKNKINKIINSIQIIESDVIRNIKLPDDQIRQWYNEDYDINYNLISFEQYKKDILEMIDKKSESLDLEIFHKTNECFANLYYLIQIKMNTMDAIIKKRNELELLFAEKNSELSSLNLKQQKIKIQYDERGNIINFVDLERLRKRYNEMSQDIKKIEQTLKASNNIIKLLQFTNEERNLIKRGLTSEEKKLYDKIEKTIPVSEPSLELNLDLAKILEFEKQTGNENSKYEASKIKIFNKPKSKSELEYKIISIPEKIIGIIPKTEMKVHGLFVENKFNESNKSGDIIELKQFLLDHNIEIEEKDFQQLIMT